MVGPSRLLFVLFGSSIVQLSHSNGGWGVLLSDIYASKIYCCEVTMDGIHDLPFKFLIKFFLRMLLYSLHWCYFGGNDSMGAHPSGLGPHVPLPEYVENMRKIATHLKVQFASFFLLVLLSMRTEFVEAPDSCIKSCQELDVEVVDLFTALQQKDGWMTACFTDGVHFSEEGSKIVVAELLKVLKQPEWKLSLYWKSMPTEFSENSPYDLVAADGKITLNPSEWTFHREIPWD